MTNLQGWTDACAQDAISPEAVLRLDHGGQTYALFRIYAGDGLCTHEVVHPAGGLVIGNTIECPKHASVFDFTTGEVETPPACDNLSTYAVVVAGGRGWVRL